MNAKWTKIDVLRWWVALSFVAAGIPHFTHPTFYLPMMPPYLPLPLALIYISGIFEILGGIGLLIPRFRRAGPRGTMRR